jgi:hypothetical protein
MRRLLLIVLIAGLSSCSTTRLAYNRLDWIAGWQLGRYVELVPAQRMAFESRFERLWDWHRREELPRYVADLDALVALVERAALDRAALEAQQGIANNHLVRLYQQAIPDVVQLLTTLDDQQIAALRERIDKDAAREVKRQRKLGTDGWRTEMAEDMQRGLRRWIGRATPAQQVRIAAWAASRTTTPELWLDYRQAWTADFFRLLKIRHDADFATRLRDRLEGRDNFRGEALSAAAEDDREAWLQLMLDLHASLTPQQREHLVGALRKLAADLAALAAQEPPSA